MAIRKSAIMPLDVNHLWPLITHSLPFSTADRKSTRLNSSHSQISYAVFCLKTNTDPDEHPRIPLPTRRSLPPQVPHLRPSGGPDVLQHLRTRTLPLHQTGLLQTQLPLYSRW